MCPCRTRSADHPLATKTQPAKQSLDRGMAAVYLPHNPMLAPLQQQPLQHRDQRLLRIAPVMPLKSQCHAQLAPAALVEEMHGGISRQDTILVPLQRPLKPVAVSLEDQSRLPGKKGLRIRSAEIGATMEPCNSWIGPATDKCRQAADHKGAHSQAPSQQRSGLHKIPGPTVRSAPLRRFLRPVPCRKCLPGCALHAWSNRAQRRLER